MHLFDTIQDFTLHFNKKGFEQKWNNFEVERKILDVAKRNCWCKGGLYNGECAIVTEMAENGVKWV